MKNNHFFSFYHDSKSFYRVYLNQLEILNMIFSHTSSLVSSLNLISPRIIPSKRIKYDHSIHREEKTGDIDCPAAPSLLWRLAAPSPSPQASNL